MGEGRLCDFFGGGISECDVRCDCVDVLIEWCDLRGSYCEEG